MIVSVVVLPGAPLLVPELMGLAAGELHDLRERCVQAVREAVEAARSVGGTVRPCLVAIGADQPVVGVPGPAAAPSPAARGRWSGRVSTDDFGLAHELVPLPGCADGPADPSVPTALLGARWVLGQVANLDADAADWASLTWHDSPAGMPDAVAMSDVTPTVLIACLDGAASHGSKAPRAEQPDAAAYDRSLVAALESGDPATLRSIDVTLAERVGAAGGQTWAELAELLAEETWQASVNWSGHPYGVGYVVALWRRADRRTT